MLASAAVTIDPCVLATGRKMSYDELRWVSMSFYDRDHAPHRDPSKKLRIEKES